MSNEDVLQIVLLNASQPTSHLMQNLMLGNNFISCAPDVLPLVAKTSMSSVKKELQLISKNTGNAIDFVCSADVDNLPN